MSQTKNTLIDLIMKLYDAVGPADKAIMMECLADKHKEGSDEQTRTRELARCWRQQEMNHDQ